MALLKQAHGIEVKSASSTIEEVVARQFVERLARQRGVSLPPPAQMFADAPVPPKGKKASGKAPEPPKPTAPPLPPPRLIKTIRPYVPTPVEGATRGGPGVPRVARRDGAGCCGVRRARGPVEAAAPESPAFEPTDETTSVEAAQPAAEAGATQTIEEPPAPTPAERVAEDTPVEPVAPVEIAEPKAERPEAPAATEPEPAGEPLVLTPPAAAAIAPPPAATAKPVAPPMPARPTAPQGRIVPPQIRLRIEDPNAPSPEGPARPSARGPRPGQAPPAPRPASQAPIPEMPRQPLGGPRPLPSAPVRTPIGTAPGGIRTPLQPYQRPSYAPTGYVPPGQRPALAGNPLSARPGAPAAPATGRPGQPQRPMGQRPRPTGGRQKGHQIRSELQTISHQQMPAGPPPVTRTISLAEGMTVKDLADKLEVKVKDVLEEAAREAADDDHQQHGRLQHRGDARARVRGRDPDAVLRGGTGRAPGRNLEARGPGGTCSRGHRHGPRRPRQDDAAGRDPRDARRRARSRRHHAAHRGVRRRREQAEGRLPRHAGPRSVHDDARARCACHRRRHPRRRGRRRRDAADEGSHRSRPGGQRADPGGDQQDRQGQRQPRAREEGTLGPRARCPRNGAAPPSRCPCPRRSA